MSTLLLLDFDCTITEGDTLPALADYCYSIHSDSLPSWAEVSKAYASDFAVHLPPFPNPASLQEEFKNIASRLSVERASVLRVEQVGLFRGVTAEGLRRAGREATSSGQVKIRNGVADCVKSVLSMGGAIGVVSVNWSTSWIKGCLEGGLDEGDVGEMRIVSNELCFGGDGVGTGDMERKWKNGEYGLEGLWTSKAKVRAIQEVWLYWLAEEGRRTVYVGDSPTDLEALFMTSIGIAIGNDTPGGVRGICMKHGQALKPIKDWSENGWDRRFWAEDFTSILESGVLEQKFMPH
ncbi:MAG: hypothetical protein M1814_003966 [Vezdaea aestivalis]|nr:MAG: hypothetical protein M1814_003966 [Vezdaea aestivalis]